MPGCLFVLIYFVLTVLVLQLVQNKTAWLFLAIAILLAIIGLIPDWRKRLQWSRGRAKSGYPLTIVGWSACILAPLIVAGVGFGWFPGQSLGVACAGVVFANIWDWFQFRAKHRPRRLFRRRHKRWWQ